MRENIYTYIGKKITLYRKDSRLSQENLSKRVELTRTSIVNIEKGRQRPTLEVLYHIAQILGVEIIDLLPPQSFIENSDHFSTKPILNDENLSEIAKKSLLKYLNDEKQI